MRRPRALTIATAPWHHEGWIAARDIIAATKLACCSIAALAPVRHWSGASRLMARAHLRLHARVIQVLASSTAFSQKDIRAHAREALAADYLSNIQAIREALPGSWRCTTSLTGRDVLDLALQQTRGAVLWCSPFVGADLAPKKALAAYSLTQLSTPSHPFSPTRLGTRWLNPIRLRAEDQYLARRVLVVYGNSRPALDILRKVLRENGVVLVMAVGTGRRSLTFPFLGGIIDLAVGAPRLANDTGAALIPVFTLSDEHGGYRVELGPDLSPTSALPEEQALHEMTSNYVELLKPIVRAHPTQWQGWFHPATWRSAE